MCLFWPNRKPNTSVPSTPTMFPTANWEHRFPPLLPAWQLRRRPTTGMYLHRSLVLRITLYRRFPNTSGRSVEVTLAPGGSSHMSVSRKQHNTNESEGGLFEPSRLDTIVTSPVPAPSSITFLSARLYLSWFVSRKWHKTMACFFGVAELSWVKTAVAVS